MTTQGHVQRSAADRPKTHAILCGGEASRAERIRDSLSDVDTVVDRQYSSTSAFLSALQTLDTDAIELIVIDQYVEPMSVWDFTLEVSSKVPSVAVVLIIDSPTPDDYSRAMDSGARSVISYPLNYDDVAHKIGAAGAWVSTVRSAVARQLREQDETGVTGSMIALASAKGGAGSSTIALHLAIAARTADPARKVVVVDMDLQKPDLSILLNVPEHRNITDLLGVVDELTPRQLHDVLYTHEDGYSVLFGPPNGEEAELVGEHAARQILGMLRSRFDLVIVDIGSVLGEGNSAATEMSDDAYVVSTCDVLSLRGVRRINELWGRLGVRPANSAKVILNKTDRRSDIQPEAAKKIVGLSVVDVYVPDSTKTLELAVNRRDPGQVLPAWSNKVRQLGAAMSIISAESLAIPETPRARGKKSRPEKPDSGTTATAPTGAGGSRGRKRRGRKGRPSAAPDDSSSYAEAGQSSFEFLGVIILIGLIAVIGFQLILVGMTWIFAAGSANEGARAAAVGQSAEAAAYDHVPAAWQTGMSVQQDGSTVTVSVRTPMLVKLSEDFALAIPASAGIVEEP